MTMLVISCFEVETSCWGPLRLRRLGVRPAAAGCRFPSGQLTGRLTRVLVPWAGAASKLAGEGGIKLPHSKALRAS